MNMKKYIIFLVTLFSIQNITTSSVLQVARQITNIKPAYSGLLRCTPMSKLASRMPAGYSFSPMVSTLSQMKAFCAYMSQEVCHAYQVLHLSTSVRDLKEIGNAKKLLQIKYHPDNGGCAKKSAEINDAYDTVKQFVEQDLFKKNNNQSQQQSYKNYSNNQNTYEQHDHWDYNQQQENFRNTSSSNNKSSNDYRHTKEYQGKVQEALAFYSKAFLCVLVVDMIVMVYAKYKHRQKQNEQMAEILRLNEELLQLKNQSIWKKLQNSKVGQLLANNPSKTALILAATTGIGLGMYHRYFVNQEEIDKKTDKKTT